MHAFISARYIAIGRRTTVISRAISSIYLLGDSISSVGGGHQTDNQMRVCSSSVSWRVAFHYLIIFCSHFCQNHASYCKAACIFKSF